MAAAVAAALLGRVAALKKSRQERARRKLTERELQHLHHKIDKLLVRLEEHEPDPAQTQDEECAICINAKATMQTFPCGHRVVCRRCFVKTIQTAVAQRLLPLRCVICRAKILHLKQRHATAPPHATRPPTRTRPPPFKCRLMAIPEEEEQGELEHDFDDVFTCSDLKVKVKEKEKGKGVKWLAKFRRLKPPSILKGIRNRLRSM